jgi:hypothetical protein
MAEYTRKYFKVSMCDSIFMKILKQVHNLRYIERLDVLMQFLDVGFDEIYELTSLTVL